MSRYRREELGTFIEITLAEPAGAISPARATAIFEEAFGDAEALGRAWLRHERGRVDVTASADR